MRSYNAVIVGSGGREHELGRQLEIADDVKRIYFADGNAGTEQLSKSENVAVKPTAVNEIVDLALAKEAGLVVIGPEAPLALGLADMLRKHDLKVFGPSAEATQLESSKGFAVDFMERHDIPHPPSLYTRYGLRALKYIQGLGGAENSVIKADGLSGGKAVVLPENKPPLNAHQIAERTVYGMLRGELFEGAGRSGIVVQERFHGPEVSAFVVSDGKRFTILPFAQDHKRLLEGDKGPNTGGMGAYAPLPPTIIKPRQESQIYDIAERTIEGMAAEGIPYQGLLYIGLMLADEHGGDPVVIEYNARFGDPETQVVLPALRSSGVDVYGLIRSAAAGELRDVSFPSSLATTALTVCLAAEGYPDSPNIPKGNVIRGLNKAYKNVIIHHAGTKAVDDKVVTNGGRVLYITGLGNDIDAAAAAAYRPIEDGAIGFDGAQYRRDIAHQARRRD